MKVYRDIDNIRSGNLNYEMIKGLDQKLRKIDRLRTIVLGLFTFVVIGALIFFRLL
jgi:hypothetical protein